MLELQNNQTTLEELAAQLATHFNQIAPDLDANRHPYFEPSVSLMGELKMHFDYKYRPPQPEDLYDGDMDNIEVQNFMYRYRPNESPLIRKYRINMYEPVTVSIMNKPLTFFARLFNDKLINLSFGQVESRFIAEGESFQEYITQHYPSYESFIHYLRQVVMKMMICDPNGFLTVRTIEPDYMQDEQSLIKPVAHYVPSTHIIYYSKDILLTHSSDTSEVKLSEDSEETENSGLVFYAYTKDVTLRIYQVGVKHKYTFAVEPWNLHQLGYIPAKQLGGEMAGFTDQVETSYINPFYYSFLQAAVPYLNKLAEMSNNVDAIYIMRMYLEKYERQLDCPTCNGTGYVEDRLFFHNRGIPRQSTCGTCNGTGKIQPDTLFKVLSIPGDPNETLQAPAGYIDIPTNIIDKLEERLKSLKYKALEAINMESLVKEQSLAESGESKKQDRDGLNTLLENVSKQLFEGLGQFVLDTINKMRYGVVLGEDIESNRAIIKAPHSFDIIGLDETIEQLQKLSSTDTPKSMMKSLFASMAKQRYGEDSKQAKMVEAELMLDPLAMYSEDEILASQSAGARILPIDSFKHLYVSEIIKICVRDNPDFLDMGKDEQQDAFNIKALSLFESAQVPEPGITEVLTQGGGE